MIKKNTPRAVVNEKNVLHLLPKYEKKQKNNLYGKRRKQNNQ